MSILSKFKAAVKRFAGTEVVIKGKPSDRINSFAWQTYQPSQISGVLRNSLAGEVQQIVGMFEAMEESWPRLRKNLHQLRQAASSVQYNVTPHAENGKEPTPSAIEKAGFVESVLKSWIPNAAKNQNGFEDCIYDICDALGRGFGLQEIIWQVKDGVIIPQCTQNVHPLYYGWGPFSTAMQIRPDGTSYIDIPPDKFIVSILKTKTGHPITYGLERCLAWTWCASGYAQQWLLHYCQIFGQPIRWATWDPITAPESIRFELEEMLQNMGAAGYAAVRKGVELQLVESSKGTGDNPNTYLMERADRICDILLLGQTLTTDTADSGSRALGDVHKGIRTELISNVCKWAANILNYQLLPSLMRLNYGNDDECPIITPDLQPEPDPKEMAERDEILIRSGARLPEQWFYERHGVPVPKAGEAVVEQKQVSQAPLTMPDLGDGKDPQDDKEKVQAKEAVEANPNIEEQILNSVMERLTGVNADWLAPVKPAFQKLVQLAFDKSVSDQEFQDALQKAADTMPELFDKLDASVVRRELEAEMGRAMVNGAINRVYSLPAGVRPGGAA